MAVRWTGFLGSSLGKLVKIEELAGVLWYNENPRNFPVWKENRLDCTPGLQLKIRLLPERKNSRLDAATVAGSSLARQVGKRTVTGCFKLAVTHTGESRDTSREIQEVMSIEFGDARRVALLSMKRE